MSGAAVDFSPANRMAISLNSIGDSSVSWRSYHVIRYRTLNWPSLPTPQAQPDEMDVRMGHRPSSPNAAPTMNIHTATLYSRPWSETANPSILKAKYQANLGLGPMRPHSLDVLL